MATIKKRTLALTALLLTLNVASAEPLKNSVAPNTVPAKLPPGYLTSGGFIWSPVTDTAITLAEARKICSSSTALGHKWRLPTRDELVALNVAYRHNPKILHTQNWTLHDVWSATVGSVWGTQYIINLDGGIVNLGDDSSGVSHVTCIH